MTEAEPAGLERESGRLNLLLSLAFLLVMVGAVVDLVLDDPESWISAHVILEGVIAAMSLGLALFLWRRWRRTAYSLREVRSSLEERRAERDAWRRSARSLLEGLARAIDEQFGKWELTPSEREVALHLLKGYSHKRIARLTDRSERTVRQHAVAVYRKGDLAGRAELAAFFLEDLMLPAREDGSAPET